MLNLPKQYFRVYFGSFLKTLRGACAAWCRGNALYGSFCYIKRKWSQRELFKGIVKGAEPMKYDIHLVSGILWQKWIIPLKEWRSFDTHRQLSAIISPYKSVRHHFSEGRLFSSEKNLWRSVLEVNKKQVSLKSYSLKIRINSVNQILKNKEKVTQTPGPNTGCFSHRWPLLGARKSAPQKLKNNFFPREGILFKGSCTLLHCFYIFRNLKSC